MDKSTEPYVPIFKLEYLCPIKDKCHLVNALSENQKRNRCSHNSYDLADNLGAYLQAKVGERERAESGDKVISDEEIKIRRGIEAKLRKGVLEALIIKR